MPDEAALDHSVFLQLQLTPLFSGLAEPDVRRLIEGAQVVQFAAEQVIHREQQPAGLLHVVLGGHVELSILADGRRSVVEVARTGAVLAAEAMFGGGVHTLSARALTPATLLSIPAEAFRAKLEDRFDILLHMLSSMSYRLRMLVRQIAELKLKTTAQRLGGFVLSLTDAESGAVTLRFPYDKKLVARQLGMKPESLSRALAKLGKVGVESMPDNMVAVADVETLREFCAEDEGEAAWR